MAKNGFSEICRNCRHFRMTADPRKLGACKRFPPTPMYSGDAERRTLVDPGDTCGEFESADGADFTGAEIEAVVQVCRARLDSRYTGPLQPADRARVASFLEKVAL